MPLHNNLAALAKIIGGILYSAPFANARDFVFFLRPARHSAYGPGQGP